MRRIEWMRAQAHISHRAQDRRKPDLRIGPANAHALCGVVDADFAYAGEALQALLDQPHAGGAVDAFEQQFGAAYTGIAALHETPLHCFEVEAFQIAHPLRHAVFGPVAWRAAMAVIIGESAGDDGRGHRSAASAAHIALGAVHKHLEVVCAA